MAEIEDQELLTEVTREILAAQFPEELPLLRAQSQAFFDDPEKALERKAKGGEEMLAFGPGEAVALVTPVALAVVTDLIPYMLEQVRDSIKNESEPYIKQSVRRLFKKLEPKKKEGAQGKSKEETPGGEQQAPPSEAQAQADPAEDEPVALTAAQLKDVRARAVEKAKALGLEDAKAELLADAIAGSLRTR